MRSAVSIFVVMAVQLLNSADCKPSGPFYIQSLANCEYLDVLGESKCPGAKVITAPLGPRKSQRWTIRCVKDGYMIINCYNGLAMDVEGGGLKPSPNLVLWPINYSCNQRFNFEKDGVIKSGIRNLALDVCNPQPGKRSMLVAYPRHGKLNQKFRTIAV